MSRNEVKAGRSSGLRTLNVTRSVHLSIGCMSSVDIHAPPSGLGRQHLHCQSAERCDGSHHLRDRWTGLKYGPIEPENGRLEELAGIELGVL